MLAKLYAPLSLLMTSVLTPVCVLVAVMETPGISAPVGSATVPLMTPCWANAVVAKKKKQKTSAAVRILFMFLPSRVVCEIWGEHANFGGPCRGKRENGTNAKAQRHKGARIRGRAFVPLRLRVVTTLYVL